MIPLKVRRVLRAVSARRVRKARRVTPLLVQRDHKGPRVSQSRDLRVLPVSRLPGRPGLREALALRAHLDRRVTLGLRGLRVLPVIPLPGLRVRRATQSLVRLDLKVT